jgi:hypothetical protein
MFTIDPQDILDPPAFIFWGTIMIISLIYLMQIWNFTSDIYDYSLFTYLKFRRFFSDDELKQYSYSTQITDEFILNKNINNPFQKWNSFQKQIILAERDLIKIPLKEIQEIIISAGFSNYEIKFFANHSDPRLLSQKNISSSIIYSIGVSCQDLDSFLPFIYKKMETTESFTPVIKIKFENKWGRYVTSAALGIIVFFIFYNMLAKELYNYFT